MFIDLLILKIPLLKRTFPEIISRRGGGFSRVERTRKKTKSMHVKSLHDAVVGCSSDMETIKLLEPLNLFLSQMNASMEMWPQLETAVTTTIHSASYFQITVVAVFFYWLLNARIRGMLEVMSTKVVEMYEGSGAKSNLHNAWSQRQRRKMIDMSESKKSERQDMERLLCDSKESPWNGMAQAMKRPVVGLSCESCTPTSRTSNPVDESNVINVLNLGSNLGFFKGAFTTISHCLTFQSFSYPYIFETVLEDPDVQKSINDAAKSMASESGNEGQSFASFRRKQEKRARQILVAMHSKLSNFVMRVSSWVFYVTLPLLFKSISIPESQLKMLKKVASESGLPLIFLPLHKSHIDYIAVTFTLCNNDIRAPLVAAGDNLRIPIFGRILQGLGAFYIKRRMDPVAGKKDQIYRSILKTYMTQCLQAGHNFEFFIEGGRTRTGKPCNPKGGLLSVFVDAYNQRIIEDALLVPVSINYEKIVEGSFVNEQCGGEKKPETFMSAIKGIYEALTSHYGIVRVDINQPFYLNELVRQFQSKPSLTSGRLHVVPSTASLHGMDVADEQRQIVDSIARHIVYDCSRSTAVMSTNALAFLLLNVHRNGATLGELTYSMDKLRLELSNSGKELGFSGESKDVLEHAIDLLGPGLVQKEKNSEGDIIIKPVTIVPNIIQLAYYNNTLLPHFALEGIIARSILLLPQAAKEIHLSKMSDLSFELCDILQFEFIFTKPCQSLEVAISNTVTHSFVYAEVLSQNETQSYHRSRFADQFDFVSEDEEVQQYYDPTYTIDRSSDNLKVYGVLLVPILDCYSCVFSFLYELLHKEMPEKKLIKEILDKIKDRFEQGIFIYGESVSTETIKNCLKYLEKKKILECDNSTSVKIYSLSEEYKSESVLDDLCYNLDKFRPKDSENAHS